MRPQDNKDVQDIDSSARIVVADDGKDNRRLLAQILANRGYRVWEAVDGRNALDVISTVRPDLLLLDLRMPRMDGFAVLEALAEKPHGFLPVIVISALTEREDRLKALRLGANEFVNKPVDAEELCVRISTLLDLKAAREEVEAQSRLLASHNEQLEYEVVKRTANLTAANERLKQAHKHKDDFLSVVSHEFRTPLAAIAGAAANLADGVGGLLRPPQRQLLDLVVDGADRLTDMGNDLIQFAELRSHRAMLEFGPTPFDSLVEEALRQVKARAAAKSIVLEAHVAVPRSPCIDARRIHHVLCKLLDNAVKFTPGAGCISIRAFEVSDMLRCEISDSGIGIPAADLPHLFDLFRQLDMSTTREAGGLGLGLALARAYVEGHGGSIEATSQVGIGSTFSFSLPMDNEAGVALPARIPAAGEILAQA